MNADALKRLIHKLPFVPLEVELSSGMKYQIRHPELAMVLKSTLVNGDPESDDVTFCSLLHISSVKRTPFRNKK